MPNYAKGHEEARKTICCVCFRKQKEMRTLTSVIETQICDLICNTFSVKDPKFSTVICRNGPLAISAHTKVNILLKLQLIVNLLLVFLGSC